MNRSDGSIWLAELAHWLHGARECASSVSPQYVLVCLNRGIIWWRQAKEELSTVMDSVCRRSPSVSLCVCVCVCVCVSLTSAFDTVPMDAHEQLLGRREQDSSLIREMVTGPARRDYQLN